MTTGVILQPSYIPWRGVFDLIHDADVFVFYDDVQYDKHGWRNRNRIKTPQGSQWLTIPIASKGNTDGGLLVKDARIAQPDWAKKHIATLRQNYKKAPHFDRYMPLFEKVALGQHEHLADLTIDLTIAIAGALGLEGKRYERSSRLGVGGGKTERLVALLEHLGCDRYVSGPAARDYIEPELFAGRGIALEYKEYAYPEYEQLYPPFDPHVTVLDLLFMQGPHAETFIWKS